MSGKWNGAPLHPRMFPSICRTCLNSCEVKSMKEQFYEDMNILQLLPLCVSVQGEKDGLPENMCQRCVDELIRAHVFILKCRDSDDLLRLALGMFSDEKLPEEKPSHTKHSKPPARADDLFDPSILNDLNIDQEFKECFPDVAQEIEDIESDRRKILLAQEKSLLDGQAPAESMDELREFLAFADNTQDSDSDYFNDKQSEGEPIKVRKRRFQLNCSHCDLVFLTRREFEFHTEALKHPLGVCDVCGHLGYNRRHFLDHLASHRIERPIKCSRCPQSFYLRKHFTSHWRIHSRPHVCKICGKAYSKKDGLRDHSNSHTGERPYMCNYCGQTFSTNGAFHSHLKTHNTNPRARVTCQVCGKDFATRKTLKYHLITHTRPSTHTRRPRTHTRPPTQDATIKCKYCPLTFWTHVERKRHVKVHMDWDVMCNICGKKFYRRGHLVMHMRVHNGETGVPCSSCKRRFFNPDNLRAHSAKCQKKMQKIDI